MPSKYDDYWLSIIREILQIAHKSETLKQTIKLDVSALARFGSRQNWHGNVEISDGVIANGKMAHAMSLGKLLLKQETINEFSHLKLKFTITTDLKLKISVTQIKNNQSNSHTNIGDNDEILLSVANNMDYIETLYSLLSKLPIHDYLYNSKDLPLNGIYFFYEKGESVEVNGLVQNRIVRIGTHNADGRFKSRIRTHYKGNKNSSVFRKHVGAALIKRNEISNVDLEQWMKQMTPTDNSVEDLINNRFKNHFYFRCIYVDRKKQRLYLEKNLIAELAKHDNSPSKKWLGHSAYKKEIKNSGLWNVNHVNSEITLNDKDISLLNKLIDQTTAFDNKNKKRYSNQKQKIKKSFTKSNRKVLCFIQCCKSKKASGNIVKPESVISKFDLPNTFNKLLEGRSNRRKDIDQQSPKTSAFQVYTGSPYNVFRPHNKAITDMIHSGQLRFIIISAGYGIVDALEPIHNYESEMKRGKNGAADDWKDINLADVIADLILKEQPCCVYGFFPGEIKWSAPGPKYRHFFTEGLKTAIKKGYSTDSSGCFYRKEGKGVKAILGSLGRTFIDLVNSNFDESYVKEVHSNERKDGNVTIGFDTIT